MNHRTLCILLVLVACFSIAFAIPEDEEIKNDRQNAEGGTRNEKSNEMKAKDAAKFEGSATLKTPGKDEQKPDESATPAKGAAVTDSFFTIGALTMAAVYIV